MPSLFPQPGPSLPTFRTLLVKGTYHPSAPIHLSLSCTSKATDSHAILISPSRQNLTRALQEYNDEWLKLNSGLGGVSSLSARVKLFYPPSPAHLCLLLSTFAVPSSAETNAAWLNAKTTLATPPSLIILHEPSAYFLSNDDLTSSRWTLSSYISLITHALSSLTFLSSKGQTRPRDVSFALFDSRLDQLRLPMSKQPTYHRDDDDENRPIPRLEPVCTFVQKYFEWFIVATQESLSVHGTRRKKTMVLHRNDPNSGPVKTWEWWEGHDVENANQWQETRLLWQD